MRILNTITVLAVVAVAALAGAARAGAAVVHVQTEHCATSADPAYRAFDTDAYMARIKGAKRMGIRFDLQMRGPAARRYHAVAPSSGFGRYLKSKRGVGAYRYFRTTNGLSPRAAWYRMHVSFRWYGRDGKVLRTVRRDSAPCHQPEGADLVVRRASVTATSRAGVDRYAFRVLNRGHVTLTSAFDVSLTLPGGTTKTHTISHDLAPGQSVYQRFSGPCSAIDPASVTLDPPNAIAESRELNNRFTFAGCP